MDPAVRGVCDPASCAIMGSTTGMVASCPTLEVKTARATAAQQHADTGCFVA